MANARRQDSRPEEAVEEGPEQASGDGPTAPDNRKEGKGQAQRKGPASAGSVFIIKISEEAFAEAMRAIYVQSLAIGKVQSMRRAAVVGLRTIMAMNRGAVMALLSAKAAGWHRGDYVFYIQLNKEEAELLKDVKDVIGAVDATRRPDTLAETLALGFCAGANKDGAQRAIIDG